MGERTCTVDGCQRKHHARDYCRLHLQRWQRHGDPHRVDRGGFTHPTGAGNPKWIGDRASYNTVHNRLRKQRGTPSCCERCGSSGVGAYQWALDWTRVADVRRWPKQRRGGVELLPYSVNLEDYIRLCLRCHRAFDLEHSRPAG